MWGRKALPPEMFRGSNRVRSSRWRAKTHISHFQQCAILKIQKKKNWNSCFHFLLCVLRRAVIQVRLKCVQSFPTQCVTERFFFLHNSDGIHYGAPTMGTVSCLLRCHSRENGETWMLSHFSSCKAHPNGHKPSCDLFQVGCARELSGKQWRFGVQFSPIHTTLRTGLGVTVHVPGTSWWFQPQWLAANLLFVCSDTCCLSESGRNDREHGLSHTFYSWARNLLIFGDSISLRNTWEKIKKNVYCHWDEGTAAFPVKGQTVAAFRFPMMGFCQDHQTLSLGVGSGPRQDIHTHMGVTTFR